MTWDIIEHDAYDITELLIQSLEPVHIFVLLLIVVVIVSILVTTIIVIPKILHIIKKVESIHEDTIDISDAVNHKEPHENTLREKVKSIEQTVWNLNKMLLFLREDTLFIKRELSNKEDKNVD